MTFFITINFSNKIPVYRQIVQQFESAIISGKIKPGEQVPSMNELAESLNISKETVKKAYGVLRDNGLLESYQGKGFYISPDIEQSHNSILLIFDKLSTYKQVFMDAFCKTMGSSAKISILLHNQSHDLLKYFLDENLGLYDYYVVTPHFARNSQSQQEAIKQLQRISNRQLIIADYLPPEMTGKFGAVYQDFRKDAESGLVKGLKKIKQFGKMDVITLPNSLYGDMIEESVKSFCEKNGIEYTFHNRISSEIIESGHVYLMLNSQADQGLIQISKIAKEKNLRIGKDINIISYNESPICELFFGGLTTISTDFEKMGEIAAKMILDNKLEKVHCPFGMVRRSTF